jgi:hypothetical protein
LALPSIVAESLHAFIEAAFGYYDLYTYPLWRGIPFHFIHRFEFGDQYQYLSVAYIGNALFWAGLILAVRYWLRVRRLLPWFATPL